MKRRTIYRERTIWRRLLKGIVFVFVLTGAGLALYSWREMGVGPSKHLITKDM